MVLKPGQIAGRKRELTRKQREQYEENVKSDIDNYVYLMFRDKYNLFSTYINPQLKDIEKFLL